jgi:phage gpG-like protein
MAAAVSFDLREIGDLARLLNEAKLDPQDREQLLNEIGVELAAQTQDRLSSTDKEDPQGKPWAAIAEKTRRYYARKFPNAKPPLWREGFLLGSVIHEPADPWSVLAGAVMEYAAVHQFGWPAKNIPARPYLGISRENAEDIALKTRRFIARRFPS